MRPWPLLTLLTLVLAVPAGANEHAPMTATRLERAPVIDGHLTDEAWKPLPVTHTFVQSNPNQGLPPTQRTEVRIGYDDEALYFAARMFDSQPDSIVARITRRDDDGRSDLFAVYLDPYRDKRTGYFFGVTAAGVLLDGTLFNDGWDDNSWDGVWHAHARRDAEGWTAELKIPFSQLRYNGAKAWGINFQRYRNRDGEWNALVYTPRGQTGFVSRFPELNGLDGLRVGRTVELLPYATGKSEFLIRDDDDPFRPEGGRHSGAGGVDLRTSLGANLTFNATVNPDFGQVEIDPAVVNLSDVENFFGEKRPFFVEGSSVFRTGNNGANDYWGFNWPEPVFLYSRRIGRSPQGFAPEMGSADFVDVPVAARILGAAKVTGQLPTVGNFGTLHAFTQRERARISSGGAETRATVEPAAYYGVVRNLRELNDRRQGVGFMGTVTKRFLDEGDDLAGQFNTDAQLAVVDGWTFLDKKRDWVISGWAGATRVSGSRERITALQSNSAHYYQRPDIDHVSVDSAATSLAGHGARFWLNKQNGRLMVNSAIGYLSPGFENNDLGFSSRADVINGHIAGGYQWNQPGKLRQYANVTLGTFSSWDLAGTPTVGGLYSGTSWELKNRWSINGNVNWNPERLSVRATRGGPVMRFPAARSVSAYFDTDGGKPWFWSVNGDIGEDDGGSTNWSTGVSMRWLPRPNLSLRFSPQYSRSIDNAQFVRRVGDPTATATYGSRYVFAEIDQKTLIGELRADYSATPNLTFTVYVQPLLATGAYHDYKELARGRTYDFNVYGQGGSTYDPVSGVVDPDGAGPAASFNVGAPDFNIRSLRGNAVMRWEYMPGSALYVVWTQDRFGAFDDTELDVNRSLAQLARTPMNNVFLVKVTRHFAL